MKKNLTTLVSVMSGVLLCAIVAPAQTTDHPKNERSGASLDEVLAGYDTLGRKLHSEPAPAPAPAPAAPKSGNAWAYFPSGRAEGSGLLLEKSAPAEVLAGQPYKYSYKVSNLTDATLENVTVNDRVTSDFTPADSDPKATTVNGGNATWALGTLGPKEAKTITVNGSSPDEGVVTTCGWATYNPVACQDIHVVKANIQLTKSEPANGLICDPIPVDLVVKNSGTSPLTGVTVTDPLATGLTSDGKSSLTFNAGTLNPGESKEFKYLAAASTTGKLESTAKATATEGVSAEATAGTTVHQPVLTVTCKTPEQQFIGRKIDVSYTVADTGDAAAAGSKLEVTVPAGATVVSTSDNGAVAGSKIDWDLGTVDNSAPKTVTATFLSAAPATLEFSGSVKGACAAVATTSCSTKVVGIPAILLEKADNPDPVAIGDTTTYTVKITNQGSADDNNVHVTVTVDNELVPVSASEGTINGQVVDLPVVPTLAPKAAVTYTIVAKGVTAGKAVTKFELSSDMLTAPIHAEESTTVY